MFHPPCAFVVVSSPGNLSTHVDIGTVDQLGPDCPAGLAATVGNQVLYRSADAVTVTWQGRPYAIVPAASVVGCF